MRYSSSGVGEPGVSISMRQRRQIRRGAEYHVIARVNRNEYIFESIVVKELFLMVLRRAKKKYRFTVRNFCIMDNHIHLIIRPGPDEALSKIMQWVLSVFAVRFNRHYGYVGHVWYDRFKSRIIDSIKGLVATFVYIANNPVAAGIVDTPAAYQYSGLHHIRDGDFDIVAPPDETVRSVIALRNLLGYE